MINLGSNIFSKSFHFKFLFFLLFSILILANEIAYACKCGSPSPDIALLRADAVFEGRVESLWPKLFPEMGLVWPTYKFRIFRVWKGELKGNSVVLCLNRTNCAYFFTVGQTYLVYANRNFFDHLTSTFCDRTKFSDEAKEDFEILGPGKSVSDLTEPFIPETKTHRFFRHFWIYMLTGVMIIKEIPVLSEMNEWIIFHLQDFFPYPLLILHVVFLFALWILLFKYYHKKFPKIFWLFFLCFIFSSLGSLLWGQFALIGFILSLFFLFLFSTILLKRKKFKLTFYSLFLIICFSFIGLLVLGFSFYLNDTLLDGWIRTLLA
ncbi:MAG TPA: hypothetical protein VMZ49_02675 [Patescibacteria group bacterium]|nr:hypothetical protein [Patescibacteria group bacterium]